jgi:hypothetical protein
MTSVGGLPDLVEAPAVTDKLVRWGRGQAAAQRHNKKQTQACVIPFSKSANSTRAKRVATFQRGQKKRMDYYLRGRTAELNNMRLGAIWVRLGR